MKLSRALLFVGLGAHVITGATYLAMSTIPSSSGAGMLYVLFVFPGIWVATVGLAIFLVVSLRNKFLPDKNLYRILGFLLCTPIPILIIFSVSYLATEEDIPLSSVYLRYQHGIVYKYEHRRNSNDFGSSERYYRADSLELLKKGEVAYMKDSTWLYLSPLTDTLKIEYYRNDSLIRTEDRRKP